MKAAEPVLAAAPPPIVSLYQEPKNSLRRRTFQLANDLEGFEKERENKRMLIAPALLDDAAKAKAFRNFDIETLSIYVSRGLKERTIGIVQELRAKGLEVGYLDAPGAAPYRNLMGGEIRFLSDLAYHLDEKGDVVQIAK